MKNGDNSMLLCRRRGQMLAAIRGQESASTRLEEGLEEGNVGDGRGGRIRTADLTVPNRAL